MKRLDVVVEMNDGTKLTVQTSLRDYVNYEVTAKKQKPPWGGMSDNNARWEAFVSWSALKRTGLYEGTWEAFLDDAAIVDATPVDANPTTVGAMDAS